MVTLHHHPRGGNAITQDGNALFGEHTFLSLDIQVMLQQSPKYPMHQRHVRGVCGRIGQYIINIHYPPLPLQVSENLIHERLEAFFNPYGMTRYS
jgi:hypothetical protein